MKIRRFFGKDMREALNQVKEELGGDAVIMSNKKLADGVEIVAAYDQEPVASAAKLSSGTSVSPGRAALTSTPARNRAAFSAPEPAQAAIKPSATLSEIIGESGSDSLKALLEKQQQSLGGAPEESHAQPQRTEPSFSGNNTMASQSPVAETPLYRGRRTPAQASATATPPETQADNVASLAEFQKTRQKTPVANEAIDDIRQELKSLRDVLEFQVSGLIKQEKQRSHPLQAYLTSRLVEMGINQRLADEVVSYAPAESDEREAWLFILKLLANKLRTGNDDILTKGGVVALVGPTGSGKTTTIAKLAAQYAQKHGADKVAMVTIDSYRIAAYDQLATYGKILGCPVKKASNAQELSDVLYQFRNKQLVLIDTAGFGQRDARLIKQLETLTANTGMSIDKYLVVQANTQRQVLEKTFTTFQQDMMKGCIFTKLDECYSLGEVVSVAIQKRLPVSYLTDGQRVPEDLKLANAKYIVSAAAKLYKKYCLPHTTAQQNKQSAVAV